MKGAGLAIQFLEAIGGDNLWATLPRAAFRMGSKATRRTAAGQLGGGAQPFVDDAPKPRQFTTHFQPFPGAPFGVAATRRKFMGMKERRAFWRINGSAQ
jgi:hypothetical protein